ncbi:hypothetical protein ABID47_004761 [Paenibacillus favisporus]|uniref:Alpha/beta hydrolase n=1 Tax=Paenibacillus favisporus TaxID=221028 RepID=A0ABV2F8N1_9BACL
MSEYEFFINNCNSHLVEQYSFSKKKKVIIDFRNSSDTLLIFFGGISKGLHSGMGIPLFEYLKISESLDSKKVFIRDFDQAWYHKGLGVSNIYNMHTLKTYLEGLIKISRTENVVLIGNSMGGYASILLGSLINYPIKVLAFSPQTFIGKVNSEVNNDNRWYNEMQNIPEGLPEEYLDLNKMFNKRKNDSHFKRYIIHFTQIDSSHAYNLIKFDNVTLFEHTNNDPESGHELVKILKNNGKLIEILKNVQFEM